MKKSLIFLLFFGVLLYSCGGGDSETEPAAVDVDPSDANALASALVINGASTQNGAPPAPSTDSQAPYINANQSSATITNDNTLVLPFNFSSNTSVGYSGCYIQVQGASTYWDLPGNGTVASSGQALLSVQIPGNILDGNFTLVYCIYDTQGRVSNILQTNVTIAPPKSCPGNESGSDGLTIFEYDLGSTAGEVTITYETYSVPDRVDVFYNNTWVEGTGNALSSGQFPPQRDCSNASSADGYVGASGTYKIQHDPANGSNLKIYVSGCIGGGTAWDISVSCPE